MIREVNDLHNGAMSYRKTSKAAGIKMLADLHVAVINSHLVG